MFLTKQLNAALKLSPYLWPRDRKIRLRLIGSILLLLTSIGLNICVPLILRQVIDVISTPASIKLLAAMLLLAYGFAWTLSRAMPHNGSILDKASLWGLA